MVAKEDVEANADQDLASLQNLTSRARAALKALSDGRFRAVSDLEAVNDLQQRLSDLVSKFSLLGDGIDLGKYLREVQESVVEHAAMYAKSREVFGGMLQLAFCFDTIHAWLEERDTIVNNALADLQRLRSECQDRANKVSEMSMSIEVKELESTDGKEVEWTEVVQTEKLFNVDLQALDALQAVDPADETRKRIEDLEKENVVLRSKLAEATAEAAAACTAAEIAKQAAEKTLAAAEETSQRHQALLVAPSVAPLPHPAPQSPLVLLEQLEPMLVALPVGRVPGMSELQEEACDTYGRLRSLLIKAEAGVPVEDTPEVMVISPQETVVPSNAGFVQSNPLPPLYSWRSTSVGTSTEPPDTWRPATLISDPARGIVGDANFGRAPGMLNNSGGYPPRPSLWLQEGPGGFPRVNRLC